MELHNFGHKNESCQDLFKLVPEYTIGTLSIQAKFQLSSCSQSGVTDI